MTTPWIARLRPSGTATTRLICLPHAGGGGATFRSWSTGLSDGVDLCAVRLPGRESRLREPLLTRMGDVVGELAGALTDYLDLPYALFGYCSGALTAYELARLLEQAGRPPAHLFVCACPSPAAVERDSGVHKMSGPELADHLRALGIIPATIIDDPGLFALFEPSVRADYEIFETDVHRPAPPLNLPITVFGADDDPSTTVPTMMRWREETSGEFTMRLFPGDHSFFEQDRRSIMRTVAAELEAVGAPAGAR
ncbi:thioesterase domain-containing protein [Polymorphospora sp. NPDC050346]|uniref:thioesterase II family protein n=1 Tax=Polymorphospora sp. NPDC050346 TaxID=3155780 RepID=UPI0033FDC9AA